MKTPDKIKKGLENEIAVHYHLPNPEPRLTPREFMYMEQLHSDALDYIKQLEQRLAQAERERDAAVRDVETLCLTEDFNGDYCEYCKHQEPDGGCHHECMPYHECGWQWRGVCEELGT